MSNPFAWDLSNDRPAFELDDIADSGIEIQAFGAEYDDVDTMFAIFADGERIVTRRPEPILIEFLEDIIEESAFTLNAGERIFEVELDKERREKLIEVTDQLREANAPLQ